MVDDDPKKKRSLRQTITQAVADQETPPPGIKGIEPGELDGAPNVGAHDPSQPVYLRLGGWHPSETSRNYASGTIEPGVSAYDLDQKGQPIDPGEGEWSAEDLRDRMKSDEPKYLVQGDHVGIGGDGEPLLQNVRTVGLHKHFHLLKKPKTGAA